MVTGKGITSIGLGMGWDSWADGLRPCGGGARRCRSRI